MYKHMNLWKKFEDYRWAGSKRESRIEELMQETYSSFISVQAKQVNKLLPIGHRWRGDVECVNSIT
jgi:hypothetical protein